MVPEGSQNPCSIPIYLIGGFMLSFTELLAIFNPVLTVALLMLAVYVKDKLSRTNKLYVTYVTQRKGGQPVYHHAVLEKNVDPLEWITTKDSKDKNIYYRIAYVQPVKSHKHINTMKPVDDSTGVWSAQNGHFERKPYDNNYRNPQAQDNRGYPNNRPYQPKNENNYAYQR